MEGWIKIHRPIIKHWIYKDADKLKAWITILLEVNHESNKVLLGGKLFECKRGDSLNSLDTWARMFGIGWNKSKVRRFFVLLQNDSMIELKNESKTTRLTVCNYDSYQGERNDNETQVKRKRNASETRSTPNKNDKNVNNVKNDKKETPPSFDEFKKFALEKESLIDVKELQFKYEAWKENGWKTGKNVKIINWKSTLLNTIPHIKKNRSNFDHPSILTEQKNYEQF